MLTYLFGRDQGIYACVADVIRAGGLPYRDAWDMKPPGIFYLYWASFAAFGRSMLAPRLLDFLWTLAAAGALAGLGKRLQSTWAGVAGGLCFLLLYALGSSYWNTAQCEGFTSLPLAAAGLALLAAERRRSLWLALVCGALVGLAITIKFTVAGFLLLPCLALLTSEGEKARPRVARAAGYAVGCLVVLALVAARFWQAGALGDMAHILFVWDPRYGELKVPFPGADRVGQQVLTFLLGGNYLILKVLGLLALAGAADQVLRKGSGQQRWLAPVWAVVMLASVWVQGKYITYHWLPVLLPMGLLAAQGLRAVRHLLGRVAPARVAWGLSAMGLLALAGAAASGYWAHFQMPIRYATGRASRAAFVAGFDDRRGDFSLPADLEVARFLGPRTEPGEPLFIWGFEPVVYFLADRPCASRFIYQVPLVTEWSPSEWREELMRDLEESEPRYFLVVHNDLLPWVTGQYDDSAAQLASFPELEGWLRENYERRGRLEDFDIWERR